MTKVVHIQVVCDEYHFCVVGYNTLIPLWVEYLAPEVPDTIKTFVQPVHHIILHEEVGQHGLVVLMKPFMDVDIPCVECVHDVCVVGGLIDDEPTINVVVVLDGVARQGVPVSPADVLPTHASLDCFAVLIRPKHLSFVDGADTMSEFVKGEGRRFIGNIYVGVNADNVVVSVIAICVWDE